MNTTERDIFELPMQLPSLSATNVALAAAALLALVLLVRAFRQCLRRRAEAGDDQFFSCDSSLSLPGDPCAPLLHEAGACHSRAIPADVDIEWTAAERTAVADLTARLAAQGVTGLAEPRLLQIAWSRKLDVSAALDIYKAHVDYSLQLGIREARDDEVRAAYEGMNFVVRAGFDHEGRPLNWTRLCFCEPARMKAAVCVRGTWMAQDAMLDTAAANRVGICFVQDAYGFGWKNMSADPLWMRTTLLAFPSHPSHISRVWILDASPIFQMAWGALKGLLPETVREAVVFVSTNRARIATGAIDESLARICPRQSLPAYLGGDARRFPETITDYMIRKLDGRDLPYRPATAAP